MGCAINACMWLNATVIAPAKLTERMQELFAAQLAERASSSALVGIGIKCLDDVCINAERPRARRRLMYRASVEIPRVERHGKDILLHLKRRKRFYDS